MYVRSLPRVLPLDVQRFSPLLCSEVNTSSASCLAESRRCGEPREKIFSVFFLFFRPVLSAPVNEVWKPMQHSPRGTIAVLQSMQNHAQNTCAELQCSGLRRPEQLSKSCVARKKPHANCKKRDKCMMKAEIKTLSARNTSARGLDPDWPRRANLSENRHKAVRSIATPASSRQW